MTLSNQMRTTTMGSSVLVALLFLVPILLTAGCAGEASPRGASVEGLQLVRDNGDQILRGSLVNTAERPIRGARIMVDLYEGPAEAGAQPADTASFEVQNIEPGETKGFTHVLDTGRQLSGARIARIVLF